MHTANMNTLADYTEAHLHEYNQSNSWNRCLAGFCCILDGSKKSYDDYSSESSYGDESGHGMNFLDLDYDECSELFDSRWLPSLGFSVPEQLRRFASGKDQIVPETVPLPRQSPSWWRSRL